MIKAKPFKGSNAFMSRNLVAPEIFDALLDALKLNGAEVFLCCDPSRNGPDDFHVISSSDHEKFEDLRAKGCNLLGPQCVLSCAKENKALPKPGYTCCLAMDSVKVLTSGFDMDDKVKIEKLVTAMGGVLQIKASSDISFVIVKNVLAAKYKWALNILKKPIVTVNWLYQCWHEHRVVPQELFRVLPFSGLMICVTRIPADERKDIEKLIVQNGGKYSPELTKKCTHLICDAPEGDKYKVARRWGHIQIVNRKWFDQSIARRACLNEESYTVQCSSVSSIKSEMGCLSRQHSQVKVIENSLPAQSPVATESNFPSVSCTRFADQDLEATLSQNTSSMFLDASAVSKEGNSEAMIVLTRNESNHDGCVANDSQSEDNDLYLSECRISLVGFEASEMRKLVNMVRNGGGSHYVSYNNKLTHIVVGTPSEVDKKEVRSFAALGVIQVVKTNWLEDCDHERREIPVLQRHVAYDLLLPKESGWSTNGAPICMNNVNQSRESSVLHGMLSDQKLRCMNSGGGMPSSLEENREERPEGNKKRESSLEASISSQRNLLPALSDKSKTQQKMQEDSSVQNLQSTRSSTVFKGKIFRFSNSFAEDRRAEIVDWVNQGRGLVVNDNTEENVHYTIESHGVRLSFADAPQTIYVSSQWIMSCLEVGCLLDVGSNILYSPLPCRTPLPGFERFRFCVSQYEGNDRMLLKNLCRALGAKWVEKLTKKVTHLLCKFTSGPKYEAACKFGIPSITHEWIYECVRQNEVVSLELFSAKEVTAHDRDAGLCIVSQFPTQAVRMVSVDEATSQPIISSEDLQSTSTLAMVGKSDNNFGTKDNCKDETKQPSTHRKRARIPKDAGHDVLSAVHFSYPVCNASSTGDNTSKDNEEIFHVDPDIDAAIEDILGQACSNVHPDVPADIKDLLEQPSKDLKSLERIGCNKSPLLPDCSMLGQNHTDSHSGQWSKRPVKKDDICNPLRDVSASIYDGFSETQTESQVVGYEEDLSGMQMLIDRVRTRSSMV